ncbi:hypothetical protein GCM10022223_43200 [Kineosporia mesophila]|uniref:Uncharacterized protein n=1 Tax=Kineosporia mesophila TaxID=566012 RepID=A0ABP7A0E3_9ACTN|nr:hypothetical protein [Kineosporia mesophila]MCD5353243.1 hypothetical protein [Kineosporia mesophila]
MEQFSLEPRLTPNCAASPLCGVQEACVCLSLNDHLSRETEGDVLGTAQILARRDSAEIVAKARADLQNQTRALVEAKTRAGATLSDLAWFLRTQQVRIAVEKAEETERRYAGDGAYNRRRRHAWPRWLPIDIVVVLIAVFDTWFIGTVFATVFDIDASTAAGKWQLPLAYLPGAVLVAALITTGVWLGESVARWREGRQGWADADTIPKVEWIVPGIFTAALFFTVFLIASARESFISAAANDEAVLAGGTSPGASYISSDALIWLFTMITVLAIGVKVAHHNVHAESQAAADEERLRSEQTLQAVLGPARSATEAHELRWGELWEALASVVSSVNDIWSSEDWFRRHRGTPDQPGTQGPGSADAGAMAALTRSMPDPPPAFGPILHGWQALERSPWQESARRLEDLQREAENQATHPAFREP